MTTTMGDLIAKLFSSYEERYQDIELARIATAMAIRDLARTRRIRSPR